MVRHRLAQSCSLMFLAVGCSLDDGAYTRRVLATGPVFHLDASRSVLANQLVFTTTRYGNFEIELMNPDGTGRRRLTTDQTGHFNAAVSPSGRHLAYLASDSVVGFVSLWVAQPDGTGRRQLYTGRGLNSPAWSPDGRLIAFTSMVNTPTRGWRWRIFVIDSEGRYPRQVTPEPPLGSGAIHTAPAWSPDGTRIAYSSGGTLSVINADGSGDTPLVTGGYRCDHADWSRANNRIACEGSDFTGYGLYSLKSDGTDFRIHVHGQVPLSYAAWAPSGGSLVFNQYVGGAYQLLRVGTGRGATPTLLSTSGASEFDAQWVRSIHVP